MTGGDEDVDALKLGRSATTKDRSSSGGGEEEETGVDEVISPSSSSPSPYSTTTATSSSFEIVPMPKVSVKNGDGGIDTAFVTTETNDCNDGEGATVPKEEEKRVQFMLEEEPGEEEERPGPAKSASLESAKSTLLPLPPLKRFRKKGRKRWAGDAESMAHTGTIQRVGARLFAGRMRYVILLTSILCMTSTRSNDLSFNFTVICMTAANSSSSSPTGDEPVTMRPGEISAIFGGSGIGAIAMVLPVVYALHYAGPRLVFTALMCCSAAATAALAPLARINPMWMVPARIVQGMAISSVLPLMGCISSEWAPIAEIGKFMTILSSPGQLAQIVAMPLSAQLCVTSGWSSVYYVHGAISACCALIFFVFYRSSPRKHPWVNEAEMDRITQGVQPRRKRERRVPYRAILFSKPVWAVWIAFLGNSFGFQLIVQFLPTFLNKVLHVPIARTGFVAIIPPISQLGVKLLAGWGSDRLKCINELAKLRMFNTLAMCGCGVCLLPLGFLPIDSGAVYALFCFTASVSCLGMVSVSSMKSATLVARNFTHFVMGVVQLVVCIGMLLVPAIVSWLAPDNTIEGWRHVFFLVFTILFVANLFFCRYCSAEPESWAVSSMTRFSLPALDEAVALAPTGDAVVPEGVVKRASDDDDEEGEGEDG